MFGLRASSPRAEGSALALPRVQFRRQKMVRFFVALLIAPVLAFVTSGCAQKHSPDVVMIKPHHVSPDVARQPAKVYADVDMEDDGREAQQPPLVMRKPEADDPNEPYSPNYGRVSWLEDDRHAKTSEQTSDHGAFQPATLIQAPGPVAFQHSMVR